MTREQKFKVGDWIREKQDNTHIYLITETFMRNSQLWKEWSYDDFILWEPKAGEWCWYGYELVQVIDNSDTIKICRQNSDSYEDVTLDKLEPFIGTLPSFIKDKE